MCWYYITAGLTLWIVDYYLRINRVFNNSAVLQTCRVVVPNNELTGSAGIIELSYLMQRKKRLVDKSKSTQSASSSSFSLASSSGEIEMKALNREVAYLEIGAEVDLDDSIVEDVVREKQLLRERAEKDRSTELLLVSERALKHRYRNRWCWNWKIRYLQLKYCTLPRFTMYQFHTAIYIIGTYIQYIWVYGNITSIIGHI